MEAHTGRDPLAGGRPVVPSAGERLRADVTREVAELRCRLREAGLRADALLAAGCRHEAVAAVAEQRALVRGFERRLVSAIVASAVEREAERVLAAAAAWHEARRALGRTGGADGTPGAHGPSRPAPSRAPGRT